MSLELLIKAFMPICLVLMMVGMGAGLRVSDFTRVFHQKRALIAGLSGQLLLLPLVAFSAALVLNTSPWFAIGLIIIAASPGGIASNVVSFAVGGNMALSIGLTAISSMVCVLTIPLWVNLALTGFGGGEGTVYLPFWRTFLSLASLTLLPVFTGMAIKHWRPVLAQRVEQVSRKLSLPFLGFVMLVVVVSQFALLVDNLMKTALPLILFLGLMAALALTLSRVFRLGQIDTKTVLVEVSLQNTTLALTVAVTLLNQPQLALVPGCYGVLMFLVLPPLLLWQRRRAAAEASQSLS